MGSLRRFRHRLHDADRGASLVEYALIVALMIVTSLGAINRIERNADTYYDTTSSRIGALPSSIGDTPTGTALPGGSGSSSTTAAPTTTSTVPPTTTTTAAPTTTTAAPTTTTTAAPTTTTSTTVVPRSFISATAASSDTSGSGWRPALTVTIKHKTTNANINGATVTVTFRRTNGNLIGTASCTTGTNGQCQARRSGVSDSITTVVATVTSVTSSPAWDGATASRNLSHP